MLTHNHDSKELQDEDLCPRCDWLREERNRAALIKAIEGMQPGKRLLLYGMLGALHDEMYGEVNE